MVVYRHSPDVLEFGQLALKKFTLVRLVVWSIGLLWSPILLSEVPASLQPLQCDPDAAPAGGSYAFTDQDSVDYALTKGAEINKVRVTSLAVFDENNPREDYTIYRWANRIHPVTREQRILDQLLFDEGEAYDPRKIDESARLLRSERYLFDADIRPISDCDGKVDVEVITRDVWSLTPDLSFSRTGGENEYRLGIRESNVFGHGFEVGVVKQRDFDRDTSEVYYRDDNIRGSRIRGRFGYSNNDDGDEKLASLDLPFYQLDARRSWQVTLEQVERVDAQFFKGDEVTEVSRDAEDYLVKYGWSRGLQQGRTTRWALGYRYEKQAYSVGPELPPPLSFPQDRTLSYPFVDFSIVEDDYDTGVNLNQLHRTEDIHVGFSLFNRIGYAADALGSDNDRLLIQGAYNDTLAYTQHRWVTHRLAWSGLMNLDDDETEDLLLDYVVRFQQQQAKRWAFFASFQATLARNLNSNQQLLYGGDSGARAFDNRFQSGDRRVIVSVEQRRYTDLHLFNLIRVGWAVFLDAGRAWDPDVDDGIADDYLASVGVGLRLASSKSDKGQMLHLDLAVPLTNRDDPAVSSREIAVRLKRRF